jgi:hypothetical protein
MTKKVLVKEIRHGKRMKGIRTGMEEVNPSLLTGEMICIERILRICKMTFRPEDQVQKACRTQG